MDDRSRRGSDHTDHLGVLGDGALACALEKAFGLQLLLQCLILQVEVADTGALHGFHDELVGTALHIHVEMPVGLDLLGVPWFEVYACSGTFEHDRPDLAPGILDGEIGMSGGVEFEIRDLTDYPYILQTRRRAEKLLDAGVQFGYGDSLRHPVGVLDTNTKTLASYVSRGANESHGCGPVDKLPLR